MAFDFGQSPAMQALEELCLDEVESGNLQLLAELRWSQIAPLFDDDLDECAEVMRGGVDAAVNGRHPLPEAFVLGFQIGAMAQRVHIRRTGDLSC